MDINLKGKSVLITGASKGIGFVIAEHMAAEGCKLHLAARDDKAMKSWPSASLASMASPTVHRCDLGQKSAVEALGKACAEVDILVNNAGDVPPVRWPKSMATPGARPGTSRSTAMSISRASSIRTCAHARAASSSTYRRGSAQSQSSLHRRLHGQHRAQHVHRSASAATACAMACAWSPSIRTDRPGRHLPHVMARAKRLFGDENRWPELHAKFPAAAPAKPPRSPRRSSTSPRSARVSSVEPPSISTAGIRCTALTRDHARMIAPCGRRSGLDSHSTWSTLRRQSCFAAHGPSHCWPQAMEISSCSIEFLSARSSSRPRWSIASTGRRLTNRNIGFPGQWKRKLAL